MEEDGFTFVTSVGSYPDIDVHHRCGWLASLGSTGAGLDQIDVLTSGAQAFLVERAKRRPHHTVRRVAFERIGSA
jgi:hypothetical protein